MRPTSDTPISNNTISTTEAIAPQMLNSRLIRSATGTPLSISISNRECAMEIAVEVTVLTMIQTIGRKMAPTRADFHHKVSPRPSGGSFLNFSRKNVRPTMPSAHISTGIAMRKRSAIPTPSPMCDPKPIEIVGSAKIVTGLASSMRNASPMRPSNCMMPIARNTNTNASLIGSAVQKAGQRTPSPIFVGDMDSRSSVMISTGGQAAPRLIQKLSVNNRRNREQEDRDHHDDPADQGDRTLEDVPLRIFINKGQRSQQGHERTGQGDRTQELTKLTGENLQPQQLEQE